MSGLDERRLTGREALDLAAQVVYDHGGKLDGWLAVCRRAWERAEHDAAERERAAVAAGKEGEIEQRRIAL